MDKRALPDLKEEEQEMALLGHVEEVLEMEVLAVQVLQEETEEMEETGEMEGFCTSTI
jgi:hypothetical protein